MITLPNARPSFVLALAASALLVACGGDGGGSTAGAGGTTCPPGDTYGSGTCSGGTGTGGYHATALVSDVAGAAAHQDAHLVNAWGLAFNPTGFSWVSNAGTSSSTLYDGNGVPQPLVVTIDPGANGGSHPSGIVFNGTSDFAITSGGATGGAPFIFATLEGQIDAWAPSVDGTHALVEVDNGAAGAGYTGLAIGTSGATNLIYAANFAAGTVDVFDAHYASVTTTGGFVDPTLPAGYAPFGIQQIAGKIYVAYAKKDPATGDEMHAAGLGLVDVFDAQGTLLTHLVAAGGALDAPWGLAMAPSGFGALSGMLLVGNFGDGTIHAYDPATGAAMGALNDASGAPLAVDGLWALQFGNGGNAQPTTTLFYTAGPSDETHGRYGRIDAN
ncbi:MAG: TIGR03118 family protein [Burkholderiaceae bacterium]